jgi:hypothetical protein
MEERRISVGQVEATINYPDTVKVQPNGNLCAERRTSAGNTLRIIYVEKISPAHGRHILVVTVIRIGG